MSLSTMSTPHKTGHRTTVVITGATGGIGQALARDYAAPGIRLGLTGRHTARLDRIAQECRDAGAEVVTECLDVRDAGAIASFLHTLADDGGLDVVIANAGVSSGSPRRGSIEPWKDARRTLDININGTVNTLQPAIDILLAQGYGRLAVIGSLAAWRGLPYSPAYSASKAAIEAYADGLRGLLKRRNIHLTVVSPGYIVSPMSDRLKGPQPFRMTAERAARKIHQAIDRGHRRIAFPWLLALGTRFAALLPARLGDYVLRGFDCVVEADTNDERTKPAGTSP